MDEKCLYDGGKTFQQPAEEELSNSSKITLAEIRLEKSKLTCPWLKVKPPALSLDSGDDVSIIWFAPVLLEVFFVFIFVYVAAVLLFPRLPDLFVKLPLYLGVG